MTAAGRSVEPIQGFQVSGFLTLEDVELEPVGPLTVICGPNNVGKSSLLRALCLYPEWVRAAQNQRTKRTVPNESATSSTTGRVAVDPTGEAFVELLAGQQGQLGRTDPFELANAVKERHGLIWLYVRMGKDDQWELDQKATYEDFNRFLATWPKSGEPPGATALLRVGGARTTRAGRAVQLDGPDWIRAVASTLHPPKVELIPDVRRAADQPLRDDDLRRLSFARAPRTGSDGRRVEDWAATLGRLLQATFGPDVDYEVWPDPSGPGDFRLRIDGEEDVPLGHVGAGVREAVAIGYAALSNPDTKVLAIEEPENCLHPAAARRLVRALPELTGVQLFVSTHSSAIVNADPDSVVHLKRKNGATRSTQVLDALSRYEVVRSLGYSPADLVLTPCALWVEGPSDRLYLTRWLSISHSLLEGRDYQVMFYGGALAAHVTVASSVPPANVRTAIRALGRHSAVVVDSDRPQPHARLKRDVKRFRQELDGDPHGHLCVTWGREVENYLPIEIVNEIRLEKKVKRLPTDGARYGRMIDNALAKKMSKVAFAQRALDLLADEVPPNARRDVNRLARFIRAARDEE